MELRDYQLAAIAGARACISQGKRHVLIVAPTGAGKTALASAIVKGHMDRGGIVVWVAHRRELIRQAAQTFERLGIVCGSFGSNPDARCQVVSVQTLLASGRAPDATLVVLDECVTGETVVGGKRANSVGVGDIVESWDGLAVVRRRVTRVFVRRASSLRGIRVGGAILDVTDAHPIWIYGKGYVNASKVLPGDLCRVQKSNGDFQTWQCKKNLRPRMLASFKKAGETFVCAVRNTGQMVARLAEVLLGSLREQAPLRNHVENESNSRFKENEKKEPHARCANAQSYDGDAANNRASPAVDRRQGERDNQAAGGALSGTGKRLEGGASGFNWALRLFAKLHLFGHRERGFDDRDRGGRWVTRSFFGEGIGQAKGSFSRLKRVDHIEIYEPGRDGTFGGRCPDGLVYNFEVEGEHNFFANGVLTHNCHHYVSDEWSRVANAYRESGAYLIGLTATPERADGTGLGSIFSGLVVAAQIRDLTERGFLVPCDIVAPTREVRGNHIAQSPVDAYRAHGNGKPCLVFAPHVQAAEEFRDEFHEAGARVGIVHGALPMEIRDATLQAFDRGDLDVLVNVMVLTEGYDSPRAEVAIIARRIGSASLYLQMVGRVLRPFHGKERATLIDLTGVVNTHGAPDEERIFSLDGKAVRRKSEPAEGTVCPICGAPYAGVPPCVSCGYEGKELLTPDVQGVPLDKFAWAQELAGDKRVKMLANWYRTAHEKGHKLKSADYKYKAVFKHWPSAAIVAKAREGIGI